MVDTGGAGGIPVPSDDVSELVVVSVVGTVVLAAVTLAESVLGEGEVLVEPLVVLSDVVVSDARLEVVEAGVEGTLDAPDDNVVVSVLPDVGA